VGWSSPASASSTGSFAGQQEPEADGWGLASPPLATSSSTSPSTSWIQDEEEGQDSWLDDAEAAEGPDSSFQPLSPGAKGGTLTWVALALSTVLVLLGAWSLSRPPAPPKLDDGVQQAVQSLRMGRGIVANARNSMATDPEAAAVLLQAAVSKLEAGQASAAEIHSAREMLARALMDHHDYEEAEAIWRDLAASAPERKSAADQGLAQAGRELRKRANSRLLAAEGYLKAGQYRQARQAAEQSLSLFRAHEGTPRQVGMASGALGYAYLKQGFASQAAIYLSKADQLYPQGRYDVALEALQAPPAQSVVEQPDSSPVVEEEGELSLSPDQSSAYPTHAGGQPRPVHHPRPSSARPAAPVHTAQTKPSRPSHPSKPLAPRPQPQRIHKDDTLKVYDNAANAVHRR
jgi:hypothetical protein